MLLAVYIPIILQQTVKYSIIVQNVKPEYFHSGHKVMHREETSTLTTYLSDNLKIFTCLTPLDDQPIVIFNRVQDPCVPIQKNYSVDQQNRENFFKARPGVAQQPRYNPLYSTAAKRYIATITLSPEQLDSFRAFLPVIDNFYHFQSYVKNKQRAREQQNLFNYGYKQNNREANAANKKQRSPRWKQWADQKVPPIRLKKLLTERKLTLKEMPNELRVYALEHPEVEKVFSQPSYKENDSTTVCYKLEIKSHIKGFNLFEFCYMKQLPIENSE